MRVATKLATGYGLLLLLLAGLVVYHLTAVRAMVSTNETLASLVLRLSRNATDQLARLDELMDEDWVRPETAERLRGLYGFRRTRFLARFDAEDDGEIERQSADFQRLRRELLEAERAAVVGLRRDGRISDDVMHRVERDLDLEDSRLDM